jgi:hypothetical protein
LRSQTEEHRGGAFHAGGGSGHGLGGDEGHRRSGPRSAVVAAVVEGGSGTARGTPEGAEDKLSCPAEERGAPAAEGGQGIGRAVVADDGERVSKGRVQW